eukprot:6702067-Prorocentrum_lima.AAC.1
MSDRSNTADVLNDSHAPDPPSSPSHRASVPTSDPRPFPTPTKIKALREAGVITMEAAAQAKAEWYLRDLEAAHRASLVEIHGQEVGAERGERPEEVEPARKRARMEATETLPSVQKLWAKLTQTADAKMKSEGVGLVIGDSSLAAIHDPTSSETKVMQEWAQLSIEDICAKSTQPAFRTHVAIKY